MNLAALIDSPFGLVLLLGMFAVPATLLAVAFAGGGGRQARRRQDRVLQRWRPGAVEHLPTSVRLSEADSGIPGLDQFVRRWLPRREVLRDRLARTGRPITVGHYVLAMLALMLVTGGALMFIVGLAPLLSGLLAIAVGVGFPHLVVGHLAAARIKRFIELFPEGIDLIVRGLKSGLPITESISTVGREITDPVGIEFRRIEQTLRFGQSLEDALWATARRLDAPEFKFFVISLAVQRETGGNLAETLENLSDILRKRRQMKLKIKALSSEARASAVIIGSLPFVMFAILLLVNATYVLQLFHDPRGIMMVAAGLGSMTLGILVMAKMIRFEI